MIDTEAEASGLGGSEALSKFIGQSNLIRSLYLMELDHYEGLELDSVDSHRRFVAWYLIEGRHLYGAAAVVDRELVDAITRRDARGCHALMRQLARMERSDLDGAALRSWYYSYAVLRHKLAPFLSENDIRDLRSVVDPKRAVRAELLFQPLATIERACETASWRSVEGQERHAVPPRSSATKPTVSIVGFYRAVLGIGEDARTLFECLRHIGVPAELVDVSPPGLERIPSAAGYEPFESKRPTGSIVIFCLPAFDTMAAIAKINFIPARDQYLVGYWPWETTALPEAWHHVYDAVDEVWASSTFLKEVYARETSKPVVHVPHYVRVEAGPLPPDLAAIFAGTFSFISVFDFNSRVERKNPEGVIAAFSRAFPKGRNRVQLVLKTLHGHHRPADLDRLLFLARQDGRIVVIDGALSRVELCAMIRRAEAYISLHRAEGFGRPIVEAMLLDTPVVATGWSGCADFLSAETGYPVASELRPVLPGEYPFAAGLWAEPDLDHAALQMRALYSDRDDRTAVIRQARRRIEETLSITPVADRVAERLDHIRASLRRRDSGLAPIG